MAAWIAATKDKVRGKIVLVGKAAVIPVNFDPPAKRRSDEQVKAQYDGTGGGRGGRGGGGGGRGGETDPNRLTPVQAAEQVDQMLLSSGAVLRINDAARGEGIIVAQAHRAYDITKTVPTVILRNDDYGRVERLLDDGDDVKLQFNVVNHTYPEGKTSYNAIAEIPGTDKADEVVMLGGHLDSWHGGTGATDNAIGCSIMMEAARLLEALQLKPRRTVRVALVVGRRRRVARFDRVRETAFRTSRGSQAGVVQAGRVFQRRYRNGPPARRQRVRSTGSGGGAARRVRAVHRLGRGRREHHQ